MNIIQFLHSNGKRAVGIVENTRINVLKNINSVYELFVQYAKDQNIISQFDRFASATYEDYHAIVSEKRLLVPLDHPDPYHLWVSGTGLTHLGSAASRNAMHTQNLPPDKMTDSMRMFQMGLEDGRMNREKPASQPEWFYKGNGLSIAAPGQPIASPRFAWSGSEEPELVGIYVINASGLPVRIGFALGNEFSDHAMEQVNYLYLAHSKLRPCSFGPELFLDPLPSNIHGSSSIYREGKIIWQKEFLTGEANMSHNFSNLEYHLFKYDLFRQPGDVHIHFFGTSVLSFTDNVETRTGDIFEIESKIFGRPLRNPLVINI